MFCLVAAVFEAIECQETSIPARNVKNIIFPKQNLIKAIDRFGFFFFSSSFQYLQGFAKISKCNKVIARDNVDFSNLFVRYAASSHGNGSYMSSSWMVLR